MKSCFRQVAVVLLLAAGLSGCGNRATKEALKKADALQEQKQYQAADEVLVAALQAREAEIRAKLPSPADALAISDQAQKIQSDPEILRMERVQLPIYLRMSRADLASAVYADILHGDPADTSIYDFLHDKDPLIRTGVVRVLGLTGQPRAIAALTEATKDPDQDVRRAAVAALGTIKDPKAVPPLIDALKDSYWFVRSDAADALGLEGDPSAVKPLLDLVGDPDSNVESSAESAVVLLATKHAPAEDFAARLDDPNPRISTIAAVSLGLQKDPRALPILIRLTNSPDNAIRLQAVKALGEMGNPAAIPTLRPLLDSPQLDIRGWTIIALAKLNDQGSVAKIQSISADPNQPVSIQAAATAALNHLKGNSAPADASAP